MSKSFVITFFLGLILISVSAQLTNIEIREGPKDDKLVRNVSLTLINDSKTINIDIISVKDGDSREPSIRLRRLLDTSGVEYYSKLLVKIDKEKLPNPNPTNIVSQHTIDVSGLANETTSCTKLPPAATEKDVKELYYCHMEIKTYSYSSDYMFTILEVKLLEGGKAKSVRFIPIYDQATDRLPTTNFAVIRRHVENFRYDLNDKCGYPANSSIPDNAPLKLLGRSWNTGADVDWFNKTIGNATHVKLIQVDCGNFSKWVKTNFKVNGMVPATGQTDKSFCINMDFPYWKLQEQLNRRLNCTPAALRIVLGDEKETFLFTPIRVTLSNIYIQPKQAKLCGFMCVVMIGAGGTFAVLLIIFLILYFRNKNKQQGYEESLAKPLTSGQSPYYELKQS